MTNNFFLKTVIFFLLVFFFSTNAFAQVFTTSVDVGISARVGEEVVVTTPSSGGGGGGILLPKTAVQFSGYAYPSASVHILKNGIKQRVVEADDTGYFTATLDEKYENSILYTLFAIDKNSTQSFLINYPIVVYVGYVTHLSGILFAPTIVTDKAEVLEGDYITVSGFARPKKDMEVFIEGVFNRKFSFTSRDNGTYTISVPLSGLPKGDYVAYVKYTTDERISKLVKFVIGEENVKNEEVSMNILGDCNFDGIINLVDFSVLAYWYGKPNPPVCVDTNRDGIINLIDFSILAFYWTG